MERGSILERHEEHHIQVNGDLPMTLPLGVFIALVTGRSLQNGKMSMGNRRTERPPDPVLYGGRPSGGFVNRAVRPVHIKRLRHCPRNGPFAPAIFSTIT